MCVNKSQPAFGVYICSIVCLFLVDHVRVKEDGFLTPAEEAEWLSTMKLGENEAQPRFKHSNFLCFNAEPEQQVCLSYLDQWSNQYAL